MAKVRSNEPIGSDCWILTVDGAFEGRMGQFYMLRGWDEEPLLARPISIHDLNGNGIRFLYRVVGRGTELLSRLREGDSLKLDGPLGNGFPEVTGNIALVGGGMGVAPLLYAAKQLPGAHAYLGYREKAFATEGFRELLTQVHTVIGGSVVDEVDLNAYDHIFACGPLPMLKALAERNNLASMTRIWVSVEAHMACGIGACLVCSCAGTNGRRLKACTDGPVFAAEELDFNELDRM